MSPGSSWYSSISKSFINISLKNTVELFITWAENWVEKQLGNKETFCAGYKGCSGNMSFINLINKSTVC